MAKSPELLVDIKITTSQQDFNDMVNLAICEHLNPLMQSIAKQAEQEIKTVIPSWFKTTLTYNSLTRGQLKGEFGFPPKNSSSESKIDKIIDQLVQEVKIEIYPFYPSNNKIYGGFVIYIIDDSFTNILNMSEAIQRTERGVDLHWLEWLLKEGNKIIIGSGGIASTDEWHVEPSQKGRSGLAIMIKGGFWKVPTQFAGTLKKNFITNAIQDMYPLIEDQFKNIFEKAFNDHI